MTSELEDSEQEIAKALKQLVDDHQHGRLSMPAYRKLRHRLLHMAASGKETGVAGGDIPSGKRPGAVVWIAIISIILLLVLLGFLLR
ncbi:MAG: hypothetical protein OER80_00030 [Gammaproteobacteria bacterium]|nr:hypothetical protein [Gammaproteobacteria bacterium]MDH3767389.1 hypothetical protein [Gammaproteobacteria bacterium]